MKLSVYTVRDLRKNLKEALDKSASGEVVKIKRGTEVFGVSKETAPILPKLTTGPLSLRRPSQMSQVCSRHHMVKGACGYASCLREFK